MAIGGGGCTCLIVGRFGDRPLDGLPLDNRDNAESVIPVAAVVVAVVVYSDAVGVYSVDIPVVRRR